MPLQLRLALIFAGIFAVAAQADEAGSIAVPANRIAQDSPEWRRLAGELRSEAAVTAGFTEFRWFAFKNTPTVLKGEVRVSADRGLSLHYLEPEEQTVIIDQQGGLLRSATGDRAMPSDPRADAANFALLHLLRLDLALLSESFELYGRNADSGWILALVPRDAELRRSLGTIAVDGKGSAIIRIELRRSATQRVEITMTAPRTAGSFSPDELRRYFR
jgi:hypothetical protein